MYRKFSFLKNVEIGCCRQLPAQWNATYTSCVHLSVSVSYFCGCEDVSLENFPKCFLHQSHEKEHAKKLMKLYNQQGGQIFLEDIRKPDSECNGICITLGKNCESHYRKWTNFSVNGPLLVWLPWNLLPNLAGETHERLEWPCDQLIQGGGSRIWPDSISLTSTPWERRIMWAQF